MAKPGRNDPCPCGSGNKYKKCCLAKDEAASLAQLGPSRKPITMIRSSEENQLRLAERRICGR
ncbi:MAG TPA: SEC-C metal-binding domain-containing protein [Rhodoplanes sp.]|nr:SEC-C metal-binding domain-containing protein [Rhodoplanes sp.]